jgi:hypothetical protein
VFIQGIFLLKAAATRSARRSRPARAARTDGGLRDSEAQTEFEDWVEAKVREGRSIFGLYPPNAETKAEFEAYRKKK